MTGKKRLMGLLLAGCMLGSLPFGAAADGDRVMANLEDSHQVWQVTDADTGAIGPMENGELIVEPYKEGISVTAKTDAQGMPWKGVVLSMKVDVDQYPMFVFNLEESDMYVEIKTTKGDAFGVAENEYIILKAEEPGRHALKLKDFAFLNNDDTKSGEGEETVNLYIAFFPNGEAGNWNGAAKVSELGFMTKEAATPPTTAAPTAAPTQKDDGKDASGTQASGSAAGTSSVSDSSEARVMLPIGAIVGIVAGVVAVAAIVVVVVVMKKKKGTPPKA